MPAPASEQVSDLPAWAQQLITRLRQESAARRALLKRANAARIARLSDRERAIVPTTLSAEKLAEWLDALETQLTQ